MDRHIKCFLDENVNSIRDIVAIFGDKWDKCERSNIITFGGDVAIDIIYYCTIYHALQCIYYTPIKNNKNLFGSRY